MQTVILGIVVIVAGLGIGMLSAVFMHPRAPSTAPLPAAPRVTPLVTPYVPPPMPRPEATRAIVRATPAPTVTPEPTAAPTATPVATATPHATATPLATPTAVATKAATPAPARTPLATPHPTPKPATPAATSVPTTAPTPAALSTGFDTDVAQAVVRRYLNAVSRGDNATARALLGASPTDATVPLPELDFMTSSSQIGPLVPHRTGEGSASVSVEVVSSGKTYKIVYEVVQGTKGTIISGRDITRP